MQRVCATLFLPYVGEVCDWQLKECEKVLRQKVYLDQFQGWAAGGGERERKGGGRGERKRGKEREGERERG